MAIPRTVEGRLPLAVLGSSWLQLALQLLAGLPLELGEAEVFFHSRGLARGLRAAAAALVLASVGPFRVFGERRFAVALLKALTLGAVPLLLFGLLREGRDDAGAVLALGLLPSVAWESQRALTDTPLALVMAVATAWAALRSLEHER